MFIPLVDCFKRNAICQALNFVLPKFSAWFICQKTAEKNKGSSGEPRGVEPVFQLRLGRCVRVYSPTRSSLVEIKSTAFWAVGKVYFLGGFCQTQKQQGLGISPRPKSRAFCALNPLPRASATGVYI